MWKYDICISCCPEDRAQAETLAESLRAYRLPSNVIIRDPELDYRKIALEIYSCSAHLPPAVPPPWQSGSNTLRSFAAVSRSSP